ncbi:outer membrane efflux protein [Nitratifractor salsuginis DSM 16511]|uniref:Outer membrane efflux protein n=1 Tax=Nitratifractor salsuginis (strain DSM 16511 / JCM 12458 / E9I37-1) TaxID=749222 RepID=E6X0U4_NITSE|nr:outer membrane efflux protein [Nitratifractor salsuginis DSM 16511]
MKKLWLLSNLLLLPLAAQSDLENYLSREKNLILDYQEQVNQLQSDVLRKSWINPIIFSYSDSSDDQSLAGKSTQRTWSVGIDQPIFKSGGIYYAVKFANAQEGATAAQIRLQRRQLIVQAIETLFELRKNRLQQRQLRLKIRNDKIDIRRKREQYDAGVIDSSFLNQAILQRNRDQTTLLALQLAEKNLRNAFSLLSDRNPDRLRLPRLHLIRAKEYRQNNLELLAQRLRVSQSEYNSKMTWSKYLPTFSVNANYYDNDFDTPMPGMRDDYYRYGFRVSMPLNINAPHDIEASRVKFLQESVQLQDDRRKVESEYRLVIDTLKIIDKKIALAHSDERLYRDLLKSTREQAAAGEKTQLDVETMRNSMNMAKLDAQIYGIERQIQLLKLYEKTESNE